MHQKTGIANAITYDWQMMKEKYIVVCWLGNLESLQGSSCQPQDWSYRSSAFFKNGMFNQEGIKSWEYYRKVLER